MPDQTHQPASLPNVPSPPVPRPLPVGVPELDPPKPVPFPPPDLYPTTTPISDAARPHVLADDCWCGPTVENVS